MTSPGELLNDRYQLVRQLGYGTMGTVWEAFDTGLERTVAVKELAPGRFGGEDAVTRRERVRREAIALAQVEHPVIVTVHDLISVGDDEDPWIVMGYVPGRPLSDIIEEQKDAPLPEWKIAAMALAVLEGLRACHASRPRVYHRDVKPANIIVGPGESVHLVDFGIARIVGKVPLTDVRNIVGTPQFLAPELLDGESAGPGTDLWALGVTLYYALTGRPPFWAETMGAMFTAIKFRNPPEPREGGPLANLVLQMLRKRPEDRPDAATVAAMLGGVASQPDWSGGQAYRVRPRPDAERGGGAWVPQEQPPRERARTQPGPRPRLSALSGLPVLTQAQVVAGMPTDRAADELLLLSKHDAARIINRCDDALGGNLLSAIAAPGGESSAGDRDAGERPAAARKILQMLPPDRRCSLLDYMSSVALAAVLALPPTEEIVRIVERADTATVVGALSEMSPVRAAALVRAMDVGRASEVLRRVAPTYVADILRSVSPASRRQELLSRLPERSRASVLRYLDA
jgi:tRNA A-37 threonylcarbamoyl transferase component Bud32/flagellar motility protein MotE (MotC chaperone)